jgi:hypothetical protein
MLNICWDKGSNMIHLLGKLNKEYKKAAASEMGTLVMSASLVHVHFVFFSESL